TSCLGNGDLSDRIHRTIDQLDYLHGRYHNVVQGDGCGSSTFTAPLIAYDHLILSGTQSTEYSVVRLQGPKVYKGTAVPNLQLVSVVAALSPQNIDHFDHALKIGAIFHIDL